MSLPNTVNVNDLRTATNNYANSGDIDPTSNMRNDRVYIFHGTRDTVVAPGESQKIQEFYSGYINSAQIKTEFTLVAGHVQATENYGNACTSSTSPYISKCNYNAAFELLNFIYGGNLQRPTATTPVPGDFYEFDQKEFFLSGTTPAQSSMDTSGYVYVPSRCIASATSCRLHVAFHGCQMQKQKINDVYAKNAAYNEVGELNNIIMIYPQTILSNGVMNNPNGCWDWWGYVNQKYATKTGNQMIAVYRMIQKMMGPIEK